MVAFDMPIKRALALAVTTGFLAAAPAAARDIPRGAPRARRIVVHPRPFAAPLGVAVSPGLVFATPFALVAGHPDRVVRVPHYIGPDGNYDDYADLVRSINGTPCGVACTRRSLERWGYAPVD